ncbi:hypothetical protein [Streptomyces sp. HB132]|uniref:hypothetical protein n=1 Tax=Streptomyces sp. HB132 TaxID=767388 RepID=UPI001960D043|nr:hypothetical protein [Streptomyces sp. HB132]MBM7443043.1 hypothetical protein [Streptomyces sp. HB132]
MTAPVPVPRVGISSGSAPDHGAAELAALTLSCGGSVVDVRAGKGHAWEGSGGLATLRAAGADVSFVGVGTVLGDPAHPAGGCSSLPWLEPGLPVKVFAAEGCTAPGRLDLTLAQIRALTARVGASHLVLIETHHGYAPVDELAALCERAGTGILLDTMGLARIAPDPVSAAARLSPMTAFVQVKGFAWEHPATSRHLPLDSCAESTREVLAAAGPLRSITVESKAPSLAEDIALLLEWYATDVPAVGEKSSP